MSRAVLQHLHLIFCGFNADYALVEEHRCKDCGKLCASKQALNTHRVTHSEDRPYRCDIATCGKTFKTKDSLGKFW